MNAPARLTLVVLSYRQSTTIDAAVASALGQVGIAPIDILLSDDASPDDTHARMLAHAAAYQGPHRVTVRRNPVNLGIEGHINTVVEAAQTELIVMMAGDDISLPQRAARVAQVWESSGKQLDLIASDLVDMSAQGEDLGVLRVDDLAQWRSVKDWARRRPYIVGAAHAFTKRLHTRFGPLQPGVAYEDQAHLLRALCGGGACTIAEPLVRYRRGGVSDRMREFSGERFMAWMRRLNRIHVALHEQWHHDASLAGCLDTVTEATEREYQRERFIAALLAAPGVWARWRIALQPSPVKTDWRLRKALYLTWPGLAAAIRAGQSAWRQHRHGGTR